MTICIGLKLGTNVILAADSRRTTLPSGNFADDYQKLKQVSDRCWTTAAGNVALCNYITDLISEFQPRDLMAFLGVLQPTVDFTFKTQGSIYLQLQPNYSLMAAVLVGGYDNSTVAPRLLGLTSDNNFKPTHQDSGIIGGTPADRQILEKELQNITTPSDVLRALKVALPAISKKNPQIGPHGHFVSITPTGSKLDQF